MSLHTCAGEGKPLPGPCLMNDNCISRPTTIGFPGPTYAARPYNDG
jgi:hypothetical protein